MPDLALDLRFLHYAILVARLGSFSAAAESLDLSPTTVNRRVSLLERRLGFHLFERVATGAHLTPAGAKFVEDAERGMSTLLRAVDSARNFQKGAIGVLRIGVMTSLSGGFLAELLNAFHAKYPEVEFKINEITSESGVTGVLWGHLDLAFLPRTGDIAGCMVTDLWQERVHLAFPEGHHLSNSSRVTWDDLRASASLFRPATPVRNWISATWDRCRSPVPFQRYPPTMSAAKTCSALSAMDAASHWFCRPPRIASMPASASSRSRIHPNSPRSLLFA